MTLNVVTQFKLPTLKTFSRGKNAQVALAGERFPAPASGVVPSSKKIFKFGKIVDGIKSKLPLSEAKMTRSPSLFEVCTKIQAKEQKKVLSKVKSATESIHKLFKTAGPVSPAMTFTEPLDEERCAGLSVRVEEHGVGTVHSSHLLSSSIPQHANCRVRVVKTRKSVTPLLSRYKAVDALIGRSRLLVNEHHEVFLPTLRGEAEAPSSSSIGQPLAVLLSYLELLRSELHTVGQDVEDAQADAEGVYTGPKELVESSSYAPSPAGMSREEHNAILVAEYDVEFADFTLDSGDIEEWTDELEKEKQAKMDAHFAYCAAALAIPVPTLSAFFSSDSLPDLVRDPSPIRTEMSETSAPSLDTSLATSVDMEDSHRVLPETFRGLRRVRDYHDLKIISGCGESGSNFTCGSHSFGPSDVAATGIDAATLRRSAKCYDLRESFLSLEPKASFGPYCQSSASKSIRTWFKGVGDRIPPQMVSESKKPGKSPVSRSRQLLKDIFRPSCRVREHISDSHAPHPLYSSPPLWSCAKITRSNSKVKVCRRMTRESLKVLKERLEYMDIDP